MDLTELGSLIYPSRSQDWHPYSSSVHAQASRAETWVNSDDVFLACVVITGYFDSICGACKN